MPIDRRELFNAVAALGIGNLPFQRAVAANLAEGKDETPETVTEEMVKNAEWVGGITLNDAERKSIAAALTRTAKALRKARSFELPYHVIPAVQFNPAPGLAPYTGPRATVVPPKLDPKKPDTDDDLAFLSLAEQSHLVQSKQVSSLELTKLALARLKKYDPALLCVVSPTEEVALGQAAKADEELAAGKSRGPLHGIPWGAKDLIAYPGYKTTWGAEHFKDQSFNTKATVARKLEEAGAVLCAKLTLGALALGDVWYGGVTRNPWNPKQGSSGSSAGSASAVSAGLLPFAIGSETLGSIVSPSTRCGVTGLRPTFGRVSRAGCMALSWTMDKLGPIARTAEDCALVFSAIHGADPLDPTTTDRPFDWPGKVDLKELRVGFLDHGKEEAKRDELNALKELGVKLVPIKLPSDLPLAALDCILNAEGAAAFDELTRRGIREGYGKSWPNSFRRGQFVTAVEYLRANRLRTLLMQRMKAIFEKIDLYVSATYDDLSITNLTGHPQVCLPDGFTKSGGVEVPTSICFTGDLYGETALLRVAHAYQEARGFHRKRPPMEKLLG
jgi:Asp-tRNA(Asn)/Glu-tRNA(Gln) amidotransferase A subunit family amidase